MGLSLLLGLLLSEQVVSNPTGAPALSPSAGQSAWFDEKSSSVATATHICPHVQPVALTNGEESSESAPPPDRWLLMRRLEGTCLGAWMDDHRLSISGWVEQSFTASTANASNLPVVWNDRANRYLLNQVWIRIDRAVDTTATGPTFGYRLDTLIGSDYRFTLMRGLLNAQLENSTGEQNFYGVDLIQFYANVYVPNWFQGTEIRIGRLFTPWGYESTEGVSTPFVSRSYAFNWCPPFTHMGIMVSPTLSSQWSGKFMLANGNDVFIGDPSEEMRFVGSVTWTSSSKKDTVTLGTTLGRGKFNSSEPFNPATIGLQTEPAGRNNINVFDLVWTHQFSERFTYATELCYGYQYGVPANVPGGIIAFGRTQGTAHWGSWVQYFIYNFTDKLTGITRLEFFDDFEGQRTGFEGLYTALTVGVQFCPTKDIVIRPEIRYDHNNYSDPFEGKSSLFTSAIDVLIRF